MMHYLDNILFFHDYPEPAWITTHYIDAFWFIMTPVGIGGYLIFLKGRLNIAFAMFYLYSAMSLLVLGHYFYAPIWNLSVHINVLILMEAFAAIALAYFVACIQFQHIRSRFPVDIYTN